MSLYIDFLGHSKQNTKDHAAYIIESDFFFTILKIRRPRPGDISGDPSCLSPQTVGGICFLSFMGPSFYAEISLALPQHFIFLFVFNLKKIVIRSILVDQDPYDKLFFILIAL